MKHKIFIADYLHFALCAARNTFTYMLKASDLKILSLPEERQFQAIFFRSTVASSPLTRVIYPSLLSKQPISVRCHPNGGFYLNKEKWPKSRPAFKYRILPNFSPHTRNGISTTSPKYSDLGSNFCKNTFLWVGEPWLERPAEWFSKLTQIFLASSQWVGQGCKGLLTWGEMTRIPFLNFFWSPLGCHFVGIFKYIDSNLYWISSKRNKTSEPSSEWRVYLLNTKY